MSQASQHLLRKLGQAVVPNTFCGAWEAWKDPESGTSHEACEATCTSQELSLVSQCKPAKMPAQAAEFHRLWWSLGLDTCFQPLVFSFNFCPLYDFWYNFKLMSERLKRCQWIRALATLVEDPDLVSSTQRMANNHL